MPTKSIAVNTRLADLLAMKEEAMREKVGQGVIDTLDLQILTEKLQPTRMRRGMLDQLESMILEARAKNVMVRAFDVRYATAGIPELGTDFLYFPPGSEEVLETGNLSGPSGNTQKLKHGKMLPLTALLLVELCDQTLSKRS